MVEGPPVFTKLVSVWIWFDPNVWLFDFYWFGLISIFYCLVAKYGVSNESHHPGKSQSAQLLRQPHSLNRRPPGRHICLASKEDLKSNMIKIEFFIKFCWLNLCANKHVQLLLNCVGLQELHLQLVDTLDDPLWDQVKVQKKQEKPFVQVSSSNSLQHLVSVTFDQCHGISASILFSELIISRVKSDLIIFWRFGGVGKPTWDAECLVLQVQNY